MLARMLALDLAYARLDAGEAPMLELARSEHLPDIARRADEVGAVIGHGIAAVPQGGQRKQTHQPADAVPEAADFNGSFIHDLRSRTTSERGMKSTPAIASFSRILLKDFEDARANARVGVPFGVRWQCRRKPGRI
jgi:hypothetical protein